MSLNFYAVELAQQTKCNIYMNKDLASPKLDNTNAFKKIKMK